MYMFSVLHKDLGFPHILQMVTPYPDITALNEKGETKRIEIELFARALWVMLQEVLGCNS